MKRRDLVKRIDKTAKERGFVATYTEGGNHTIVIINNRRVSVVPRHNEISEYTARAILADVKAATEEEK